MAEGFVGMPSLQDLAQGLRPRPPPAALNLEVDPLQFLHGWQFHASSTKINHYWDTVIEPNLGPTGKAMVDSQSGPIAFDGFVALPYTKEMRYSGDEFLASLRSRLGLPLPTMGRVCEGPTCRAWLDPNGWHRGACMRSGRVQRRAKPLERMWERVAREAGATTAPQPEVASFILGLDADDGRRGDFVARGLPASRGRPLLADVALYGYLTSNGLPHPDDGEGPGGAIRRAEDDKEAKYRDIIDSPHLEYKTLAAETGGRFSATCIEFLRECVAAKVRNLEGPLRRMAAATWARRWRALLSVTLHRSVAGCLLDYQHASGDVDPTPALGSLLHFEGAAAGDLGVMACCEDVLEPVSRMPGR